MSCVRKLKNMSAYQLKWPWIQRYRYVLIDNYAHILQLALKKGNHSVSAHSPQPSAIYMLLRTNPLRFKANC